MDDVKIGDILAPGDRAEQERQEHAVRSRFWDTLRRAARHLPFAEDVVASYYCAMDPQTPNRVRGTLLAALAYFVMPFDLVPDFIVLIGFTDDIAVLAAAIAAIRTHITPAHYEAARAALSEEAEIMPSGI
jgi:uncharacterized membrane protein YkvA (DUF1232 family)